jgi:hypothetical protein
MSHLPTVGIRGQPAFGGPRFKIVVKHQRQTIESFRRFCIFIGATLINTYA